MFFIIEMVLETNFRGNVSPGFWNEQKHQEMFLLRIAKKYNVQQPSDWGKVTYRQVLSSTSLSKI